MANHCALTPQICHLAATRSPRWSPIQRLLVSSLKSNQRSSSSKATLLPTKMVTAYPMPLN